MTIKTKSCATHALFCVTVAGENVRIWVVKADMLFYLDAVIKTSVELLIIPFASV